MSFKPIEKSSQKGTPFFDEWKKDLDKDHLDFYHEKLMSVLILKAVQSGKGYILNFAHEFSVFIWKNSTLGKAIKKAITDEVSGLILIQFQATPKGLSYEIGFDDDYETSITEDLHEEGVYYFEITNDKTFPIAPEENRKDVTDIPLIKPKPKVVFTTTTRPKANK